MSKTYTCDCSAISGNDITVKGDSNSINGQRVTIIGDCNSLAGSATRVRGDSNNISGNADEVVGDCNTVNGNAGSVRGDSNNIQGNVGSLDGDCNTVYGNAGSVQGDSNNIKGNAGSVNGDYNAVAGFVGSTSSKKSSAISVQSNFGNIDFAAVADPLAEMARVRRVASGGVCQSIVMNNGVLTVNGRRINLDEPEPSVSCSSSSSHLPVPAPKAKTVKPPVPAAIDNEPTAKPGEAVCIVCMDRAVATRNIGCSHSCLCVTCARELANESQLLCPKCRAVLKRIERQVIDYEPQ